jgi:putative phosphoribosyl transferase
MIAGQPYNDRREAGKILASHLTREIGMPDDAVVLALPRGGLPVGLEVALALGSMLDVFVVRKLGVPGHEEYAMGAIAAGGFRIMNQPAIAQLQVSDEEIAEVVERETAELKRRENLYRGNQAPVSVSDRVIILVDDGLATGFTMRAAIAALRAQRPRRIVVAVPVGAADTCAEIEQEIGTVICPLQPKPFHAVGLWYRNFESTSDDEVRECLVAAALNYDSLYQSSHRTNR